MKKISLIIFSLLIGSLLYACNTKSASHNHLGEGMFAEFKTNKGNFIVKLFYEQTPMTVANFVSLAEGTNNMVTDENLKGKPFYDGLIFHRVIKDFMIQGGDPLGTGSGGPGYRFPDEIVPELQHKNKGILSMANSGPATNGSQFFITLKETPWLDGNHTVFGEVVEGQEIVDEIGLIETSAQDRPIEEVVIEKVTIIRNGKPKLEDFEKQLEKFEKEQEEKNAKLKLVQEENKKKFAELFEDAETLESGLKIHYIEKKDNKKPEYQTSVAVNYAGFLENGTLFDSNIYSIVNENTSESLDESRFKPMVLEISPELGLIPGFREALLELKFGEKVYILIPSHLAYGEAGVQEVIPPNSDLIFYIEMDEVN